MRGSLKNLQPGANGRLPAKSQLIAGVVESVRIQRTQSGRMVILNLSDGSAAQEITIYSEVFDQYRDLCKEDNLLVIEAKVKDRAAGCRRRRGRRHVHAHYRRQDLRSGGRAQPVRQSHAPVDQRRGQPLGRRCGRAPARTALRLTAKAPCMVSVCYHNGAASCEMRLGEDWRVRPDDALMQSLREWLRPENVQVIYP